ncbi:ABC transporter permease [Spirosoma sp. BT702]|uniref:ABC transporter permease n=1 Tax=Spirosoma profusum TaxID=2771354 RepID=A0A927AQL5_9BACT|nr:ABC transporter permease [Spirosoma profusum]MBD2700721.1 ABC transporter permease [Spirosoma profusum]
MLRNYIKIAWRNLLKNKPFFLINTLGLAVGMAACLLILQYVTFERSYDDFHPNVQNIYRIEYDSYQNGKLAYKSATSFPAIAPTLKKDFPEVEETARLYDADANVVTYDNIHYRENNYYFADNSIFNIFKIDFLSGDPATALKDKNTVVMSETIARKYFGNQNPLGKTVKLGRNPYLVKGVYKDYPKNSHLELDLIFSYRTEPDAQTSWGWYDFFTYVKLKPGTNPDLFQAKILNLVQKYNPDRAKTPGNHSDLLLQPLRDIHLTSNLNQEAEVNGNGKSVAVLSIIALFILVIAWINYINLATARAMDRAKEVGIRKVAGAERFQLVVQFLMESLILNILAVLVALVIIQISAPSFNELTGRPLSLTQWLQRDLWLPAVAVFFGGTLLSGLYPAFMLSGFQPITVLKGKLSNVTGGLSLRQGLIVFQFAASVILIIGTITVYQQLRYMQNQDLGFSTSNKLIVRGVESGDSTYEAKANAFKQELERANLVEKATASAYVPGIEILWTNGFRRLDRSDMASNTLYNTAIDYNFLEAYDIKLAAGRNFDKTFGTERRNVLLNETAVKLLGFDNPADALGKRIRSGDTLTIVGVVKDYHQQGLQKGHWPMLLRFLPAADRFFSLQLSSADDLPAKLAGVKAVYDKVFPGNPFEYFFLDTFFNEQYKAEQQFGKVCTLFAGLAIFIACLGLFALATFIAKQRTKEIGIRKVLGATVPSLIRLLSRDFLKLVVISIILASPLAWYAMNRWLADFAYHIAVPWWAFVLAGITSLAIALLTVSYQSIKAALMNPVKSLRSE